MTQCNTLNVKLSSSQLNKLRSQIKNGTEVTLNLLSNVIGNSNDFFSFSVRAFFHRHWQLTGQQGKGGNLFQFHSTTSTRSRKFRYLCATLHLRLIFHTNYYQLIHQFWGFLKPLQIIHQLTWNYQKFSDIKKDNQEDF